METKLFCSVHEYVLNVVKVKDASYNGYIVIKLMVEPCPQCIIQAAKDYTIYDLEDV